MTTTRIPVMVVTRLVAWKMDGSALGILRQSAPVRARLCVPKYEPLSPGVTDAAAIDSAEETPWYIYAAPAAFVALAGENIEI